MNTTQKSLLACSAICYALVLFSFLNSSLWLVLIFFILHSLALLYFSYLTYSYSQAPQMEEELTVLKEPGLKKSVMNWNMFKRSWKQSGRNWLPLLPENLSRIRH